MGIIGEINQAVMTGNENEVISGIEKALKQGLAPETILQKGMIEAMESVGEKMSSGDMFIPEVLMSASAMQKGLKNIVRSIPDEKIYNQGKVLIGTVEGDLHDIGKNLVAMILESGGFEVINLGIDIPPEKFFAAAKEHDPHVIGLSALLTTTMPAMQETVKILKDEGISAKVVVGGAPISKDFADQIGADGYASDAAAALTLIKGLVKG